MTPARRRPRSIAIPRGSPGGPAAFTLVELLTAATLALVVVAALVSLFGLFGRSVTDSRELVQTGARMRSAAWRLRQDLQGVTTEVRPFIRPESASGYLEVVEGPIVETGTTMVADCDDILMLTTASPGQPFTGLLSGSLSLESPVAEVAWFCKQGSQTVGGERLFNLYRRQLLVSAAPGVGGLQTTNSVAFNTWDDFYLTNDLSVRREGSLLIANSLADLVRRQSRFMHNVTGTMSGTAPSVRATWPQISSAAVPATTTGTTEVLTGVRRDEDMLLSNVVAFDVRVFDPQQASGRAYVDLGNGGTTVLTRAGAVSFTGMGSASVYDTWSLHTEFNGQADVGVTTDKMTNFVDDKVDGVADGVVDDAGEIEQSPPYNVPLRGLEIRIRCYEPSSRQIRQVTVQHSFLTR